MGNCYELLEIAPTASTEEIEEAYQRKKKEFTGDAAKQQELDSAYNDAIMATFAPIRAFASPLPPLLTRKSSPSDAQIIPVQAAPAQVAPAQAEPIQATPVQTQSQVQVQPQSYAPQPEAEQPTYAQPQEQMSAHPIHMPESKPESKPEIEQPTPVQFQAQKPAGKENPAAFTDAQIMNMDISEMKSYIPQNEIEDEGKEAGKPFLGIEDKLLQHYAKTYIAVVVFDIVMRLLFGPRWLVFTEVVRSAEYMPATPLLLLIPLAFVSIVFCFICALPIPFATRFFVIGHPPDKNSVTWSLFFVSITCAFLLHWLAGRLLPYSITGSSVSLIIVSVALSLKTLQYEGG